MLHGYYSYTQYCNNNEVYEYLDKDNKSVIVTEVSSKKLTDEELRKYFRDNEYKGEVFTFVKKHISKIDMSSFKRL